MRSTRWWALMAALPLLLGLALTTGSQPVRAQDPPPRPPLAPTAEPAGDSDPKPTPVPAGRITGTVIELGSGAPAPGIIVRVGDAVLTTDTHGNYDASGIATGTYMVALQLTSEQGVAAQEPLALDLAPGAVLVQHLAFRAPTPVMAAPLAPDTAPTPAALPNTGAADESVIWLVLALGLLTSLGGGALHRLGRG
ncbi:MAG: carboxypeptidase-like regulatory domain-containing protein [Chloroflexales bacterium]|nr:carboxypeptidase-like regulatory domain-containing protein [Chloroflexales bacterium]